MQGPSLCNWDTSPAAPTIRSEFKVERCRKGPSNLYPILFLFFTLLTFWFIYIFFLFLQPLSFYQDSKSFSRPISLEPSRLLLVSHCLELKWPPLAAREAKKTRNRFVMVGLVLLWACYFKKIEDPLAMKRVLISKSCYLYQHLPWQDCSGILYPITKQQIFARAFV